VRGGQDGVVQSLSLQPGQWVNPGQEMARVAGQSHLKAVVNVPEIDARDLTLGLECTVDTHNGVVAGHVSRVDPASQNGAVGVDIALDGPLPRGARPDLAVDALIRIERLTNVLHVGRPADGSSESAAALFVLDPDGSFATRRTVELGRGSANAVEIRSGLKAGDQVILSDMSRFDTQNQIKIDK
jgi:multidrug efflux pump subunit AcrA (membrane-fusion protein)